MAQAACENIGNDDWSSPSSAPHIIGDLSHHQIYCYFS